MNHKSPVVAMLTILLVTSFLVLNAFAQTGTSSITGIVMDASGAVIAGARVTARNEATGVTFTQTTTAAGVYSFSSLTVGSYAITAEMSGFKTLNKTGNILEVGTPLVVEVVLEIGQTSDVVN